MYDELVKALREADEKSMCGECGLNLHSGSTKKGVLFAEAADAIEELSAIREEQKAQIIAMAAEDKPCWIPVTERLPEKTGTYLAWIKWDLTEADEEPSAYPVLYDADVEGFGWWKSYFDGETLGWAGEDFVRYEGITHWMPLPTPPKEET